MAASGCSSARAPYSSRAPRYARARVPQFAGLGPLPKHGLARTATWQHVDSQITAGGTAVARLRLTEDDASRAVWDYAFQLDLTVTIGGPRLELALQVTNTDTEAYRFMAALHTYLAVQAIEDVAVEGLAGLSYREQGVDGVQPDGPLRIAGEVPHLLERARPAAPARPAAAVEAAAAASGCRGVEPWPRAGGEAPDPARRYRRMPRIEACHRPARPPCALARRPDDHGAVTWRVRPA